MSEDMQAELGGVDRRTLLKRSAVATGVALWAVPTIDSFLSPAAAASTTPVETSLSIFALEITCGATIYSVKVNKTADNQFPGDLQWGITTPNSPQCGDNIFQPTTSSALDGFQVFMDAVTQEITVIIPSSCFVSDTIMKCSNDCQLHVAPKSTTSINGGTQKSVVYNKCSG
jgi:hypothetical protein